MEKDVQAKISKCGDEYDYCENFVQWNASEVDKKIWKN
jgi:hypothetical protein